MLSTFNLILEKLTYKKVGGRTQLWSLGEGRGEQAVDGGNSQGPEEQ